MTLLDLIAVCVAAGFLGFCFGRVWERHRTRRVIHNALLKIWDERPLPESKP